MAQITELRAKRIAPGDKPIGDSAVKGLRLEPSSLKGRGKWILRFVSPRSGRRRDMGLGTYPEIGVAAARQKAQEARTSIAAGLDPIEERSAARAALRAAERVLTFEKAAREVHDGLKSGWKNGKHRDQWINTLTEYAFPKIGNRKVESLDASDFAEVLRPIWLEKPETASRVRQRCHAVMKWCWARKLVSGNPVEVVDHLLPQQPGKRTRVKHHPSMPWRDIPAFVKEKLHRGNSNVTRGLLEFVILTAARSGEARAMKWAEVDLKLKVWTIPADRMKAKVLHRVPLCERAIEILEFQRKANPDADLVFPAQGGGILSDMTLTKFLRDQNVASSEPGRVATAHGFRSSFRDWASENGYARDLAERALAHTVKNQAEAAYHRTDLLEQRRAMMEAWARQIQAPS